MSQHGKLATASTLGARGFSHALIPLNYTLLKAGYT